MTEDEAQDALRASTTWRSARRSAATPRTSPEGTVLGSDPTAGTTCDPAPRRPGRQQGPAADQGRRLDRRDADTRRAVLEQRGPGRRPLAERSTPTPSPRATSSPRTRERHAVPRRDVTLVVSQGPELVEVPGRPDRLGVDGGDQRARGPGLRRRGRGGRRLHRPRLRLPRRPRSGDDGAPGQHDHALPDLTPGRPMTSTERRPALLATLALLAVTAVLGHRRSSSSSDLLDRVPTLDFLAVRFAIASVACSLVAPRGAGAAVAASPARHALVLGGALRRRADPADRRARPHRRPASPASSPACTSSPPRCWPPCCCAPGSTRLTWAAVALATAGLGVLTLDGLLGRVRRGPHPRRGGALRAAHRRARRLVRARGGARHVDRAAAGIAVSAWSRPRPDGIVLPATGARLALGRLHGAWSPARSRWSAQTWAQAHLPPDPHRDHHEHGAGLRRVVRGAAGRRVGRPAGCWSAARWCSTAMLVVELGAAAQDRGRGHPPRGSDPADPSTAGGRRYTDMDLCSTECGAELGIGRFSHQLRRPASAPEPTDTAAAPDRRSGRASPVPPPVARRAEAARFPLHADEGRRRRRGTCLTESPPVRTGRP